MHLTGGEADEGAESGQRNATAIARRGPHSIRCIAITAASSPKHDRFIFNSARDYFQYVGHMSVV